MDQLQMLLFPNALCCSLYERNCVCAVTKIFTKFLPANNFCQLLRVTRKRSCTSAGNAQAQLHFQDDQQRAFGISNISNWTHVKEIGPMFKEFSCKKRDPCLRISCKKATHLERHIPVCLNMWVPPGARWSQTDQHLKLKGSLYKMVNSSVPMKNYQTFQ